MEAFPSLKPEGVTTFLRSKWQGLPLIDIGGRNDPIFPPLAMEIPPVWLTVTFLNDALEADHFWGRLAFG